MQERPIVTVTLLVYNHEKYIRQCLDGILLQKVDFPIEVLVGDDCSTDGTREILQEYDQKYPGFFTMILRPQNLGATKNLYDLLKRSKGQYIAGLEGDDYWFDGNKLQRQVDFMNAHPEYIGCSHEVTMINQYGEVCYQNRKYIEGRHWTFYKKVYTFSDYQKFELPGQGSTYLYRNVFLQPKYDYSIIETGSPMVGDMSLMLILSAQGDWFFMQGETYACYRFITTVGLSNWASWMNTKNTCYVDFCYRLKLEQYADSVLHKTLNLREKKAEIFYIAFLGFRHSKKNEDKEIFWKIWKTASPKWYYVKEVLYRGLRDHYLLQTVAYAMKAHELEPKNKKLQSNTWKDFETALRGRTLVAFGEGVSFSEFVKKYRDKYHVAAILDNDKGKHGMCKYLYRSVEALMNGEYDFIVVHSPEEIKDWDKDKFVVLITSTLYQDEIAEQLEKLGFQNYFSFGNMEIKRWYYKWLV